MDREEVLRLLKQGEELVYEWPKFPLPHNGQFERYLSLRLMAVDAPPRYPPRVLQEEPTYVFKQKMARTKPFEVTFTQVVEGWDSELSLINLYLEIHLSHLEEVDEFLVQFRITVNDFKEFNL